MSRQIDAPKFHELSTHLAVFRSKGRIVGAPGPESSAVETCEWLAESAALQDRAFFITIEAVWQLHRNPEYRVYSAMCDALAATNLNVGCSHLRLPYPAFNIRFPIAAALGDPDEPSPIGLSVASLRGRIDRGAEVALSVNGEPAALVVIARFPNDAFDVGPGLVMPLDRSRTVEQQLARLDPFRPADHDHRIRYLSHKTWERLLKIALGVTFLATGKHRARVVEQVVPPRHERRRHEKSSGAKGAWPLAFSVGRELVLPRPESHGKGNEAGSQGKELRWSHIRSGHFRWQATGPREGPNDYELIFIEPTVVRRDLPARARSTPNAIRPAATPLTDIDLSTRERGPA